MTDSETQREATGSDTDVTQPEYTPSSYGRVQVMADETVYEAGPSFVEDDRPTDRLTEMPAWLQSFAASERGSRDELAPPVDEGSTAVSQQTPPVLVVEPDETLPEWLRTEPAHAVEEASAQVAGDFDDFQLPGEEGPDSFISEDDLPDWLKAFSHESTGKPAPSVPTIARVSESGPSTSTKAIRVPPVENVWLSAYDRQAIGPGRTLFALLASSGGVLTEVASNGTQSEQRDPADFSEETGIAPTPAATVATATRSGPVGSKDIEDKPGTPLRLMLLALLVAVLLIFVMLFLI